MTYATLPERWDGATVACVASGPSLTAEDCEYLRGRARVIAVNDGIRLTKDFADLMYGSDHRFWNLHKGYPAYTGPKYAIEVGRGAKHQRYEFLKEIQIFRNVGEYGLSLEPDAIFSGKNSGSAALNVAVHTGAKRILLLGYNMGPINGRLHFFDNAPAELEQQSRRSEWWKFIRAFEVMVEPLKTLGVEVINCTPGSHLKCFPGAALRDVLPDVQEAVA